MDVPVLLASFIQHLQIWSCGFHPEQGGVSASVKEFKFESETGDYVKDDLCSHPHLCPQALGGDQNEGGHRFPEKDKIKDVWAQP